MVADPPESSDSDSLDCSDSELVESFETARVELRMGIGECENEAGDARSLAFSSESERDGGRSRTGEEVAELKVLFRAAISRKAATDIRCEESELALSPLGRGLAGGTKGGLGSAASEAGDSGPTCRNDLRLKESEVTSTSSCGGVSVVLDFLRSLCAHENSPPPDFFGAGELSVLVREEGSSISCEVLDRPSGWLGNDLVDIALCGSPYVEKRVALDGGGRMRSKWASDREL